MTKVAIIGGSGYTGYELLRLLAGHEKVEVCAITSRQFKGTSIEDEFPSLKGFYEGRIFIDANDYTSIDADIFFLCLPHSAGMEAVKTLINAGKKVIDLSADFRIKDPAIYEEWYTKHTAKELIAEAVYGLPELYREKIRTARLIANPGCYPTSVVLGLLPLLKDNLIDTNSIIIDSKSGSSGAGRTPGKELNFVEESLNFKAYKVGEHRHTPEIEQELSAIAKTSLNVSFTPHLLPVSRGILSTIYANLHGTNSTEELLKVSSEFYDGEPFIRILSSGKLPELDDVRGTNFCDIGLKVDARTGRVIVISAIDNLTKGASGAAIQNMNLMVGFDEEEGLLTQVVSV
ncbi:MAG: N-acetyl-gamma-glutamyl-phosphate reductase [Deltaproteobacteria bacterium]|nr:N-acetyl-gamma-glutamyl-phosphate reductase [Deltaproteobacteria bacterium]